MKVFLSHSSKDKGFVEEVAELLRPGTFELDSLTFDAGLVNSEAIIKSLQRCDLFCLFLSSNSINSSYVDFETLLGIEFLAGGKIGQFLVICIEDDVFKKASANVKFFNVVRKSLGVESTARLIQGNLISAAKIGTTKAHPFIGREDELIELAETSNRPQPTAIESLIHIWEFWRWKTYNRPTFLRRPIPPSWPHFSNCHHRTVLWTG